MNHPTWLPSAKSASIRKWADNLHKQAKDMFLKDKTHAHILFSFKDDEGLAGINPVPPKTDHLQIYEAIRRAVKEHDLYAVMHIGEAWTYFPKERDHTAFQLLDGEMKVSDLRAEDKSECLYLRMESRDGDCVVFMDKIERHGETVKLGEGKRIEDEDLKWFEKA